MKTRDFLAELARFGWVPEREGAKHLLYTNQFFRPERPLTLRHQDVRDIDPIVVSIQAKHAGLIWDQRRQEARPNPSHPYFRHYQACRLAA